MNKTVKKTIEGIIATILAAVGIGIFMKVVWSAWDTFIAYLISHGFTPSVEYVLGFLVFILAIWLGAVQLKKLKKNF